MPIDHRSLAEPPSDRTLSFDLTMPNTKNAFENQALREKLELIGNQKNLKVKSEGSKQLIELQ